jgi:peptidylprolyl isomerase
MRKATGALATVLLILALAGCAARAATGKVVTVSYRGTLADGSVFDTSEGSQPLEFRIGGQQLLPSFEQAVIGMRGGEQKTFTIKAADAYGDRDESLIVEVPKASFPSDLKLAKGMQLGTQGPQGAMVVTVADIRDQSVMIDYNHPLAGKDLTFDIQLVSMRDATKEELAEAGAADPQAPAAGAAAETQPAAAQ